MVSNHCIMFCILIVCSIFVPRSLSPTVIDRNMSYPLGMLNVFKKKKKKKKSKNFCLLEPEYNLRRITNEKGNQPFMVGKGFQIIFIVHSYSYKLYSIWIAFNIFASFCGTSKVSYFYFFCFYFWFITWQSNSIQTLVHKFQV